MPRSRSPSARSVSGSASRPCPGSHSTGVSRHMNPVRFRASADALPIGFPVAADGCSPFLRESSATPSAARPEKCDEYSTEGRSGDGARVSAGEKQYSMRNAGAATELIKLRRPPRDQFRKRVLPRAPPTERSSGSSSYGSAQNGTFVMSIIKFMRCDGHVSARPRSPSDLRIPASGGPSQHVPVTVVKPRDAP